MCGRGVTFVLFKGELQKKKGKEGKEKYASLRWIVYEHPPSHQNSTPSTKLPLPTTLFSADTSDINSPPGHETRSRRGATRVLHQCSLLSTHTHSLTPLFSLHQPSPPNPMKAVLLTALAMFANAADIIPTQLHLAQAGNDGMGNSNGVTLSYQTVHDAKTEAFYSRDPSDLNDDKFFGLSKAKHAKGYSSSYYQTYDHHVKITNLVPDTTYYYRLGDPDSNFLEKGLSDVYSFKSAPLSEDVGKVKFATFGDLGLVNGGSTINYLQTMVADKDLDLIFHVGDVGYADDSFLHFGCFFRE